MTPLEQETFRDGFRVCLLCTDADRRRHMMAFRAILFDGGQEVDAIDYAGPFLAEAETYLALRRFLVRVAAPPHVLAVSGRGARQLLQDSLSDHLPTYRLLDLDATAQIVRTNPSCARAHDDEPIDAATAAELLWQVVAAAGRQGMDWPTLLTAAESARPQVAFHSYLFNEITLLSVPHAPGVYIMRDAAGAVLYVGKAANLNRRLQDYFRRARELPAKRRTLRDRIQDFEVQCVGSELEALLLENRLINQHHPNVNVQRMVAEGRSRYAAPLLPVVLFEPSAHHNRVELFCFAPNRSAVQLRFNPPRPARKALHHLIEYAHARRSTPPRGPTATDWGPTGAELCVRYFGSRRARLQWIEIPGDEPSEVLMDRIQTSASTVLANPREATEFRE